jgi:hypothetical protein
MAWSGRGLVSSWAVLDMGWSGQGYSKRGQDWLWPEMDTSNFEIFKICQIQTF